MSLKTTFRLFVNDSKWRRSLDTIRFAVGVGLSRWCTTRTGLVSLDRPGSGKWTCSFFSTRYYATGRELRTSTANPTACTTGCEMVLHKRKLSRKNGERFLVRGHNCVPCAEWLSRYSTTVLPNGAHFRCKGDDGLWWLGKISASTTTKGVYLVRFLDDPGPIKLPLPPARYTTLTGLVRGSWCPQVNIASAFARGVQRNVHESRGVAVVSWCSHRRCVP